MSFYYLSLENILAIHEEMIHSYGGRKGIREKNLLLSALEQPKCMFNGQYLNKTIFEKAASYLFHICKNHPFIDGNKRTALVSAFVFLDLNQYEVHASEEEFEELVMGVAEGSIKKSEVSKFFKKYARKK